MKFKNLVEETLNEYREHEFIDFVALAKTKNADYTYNDFMCLWKDGEWIDGVWIVGHWDNGIWHDGVMEECQWENGVWCDGTAVEVVWLEGVWLSGNWEKKSLWLFGWIYDPNKDGNISKKDKQNGDFVYTDKTPAEYWAGKEKFKPRRVKFNKKYLKYTKLKGN